ncbi:MAG TPA: PQQ-binding-like beta-propeller repeat protein [Vicinamibacterales bacterium]|jgi:alcohol dehydrogenase (cytochrome c)
MRVLWAAVCAAPVLLASWSHAQIKPPSTDASTNSAAFVPVTEEMLISPSPDDWLMYSRTYDAQRFSPLKQISRENVGQLREVFKKELGMGAQESIPIVYRGVMYMIAPGASVLALDAATGQVIWEHQRPEGTGQSRTKALAIFEDLVLFTSPDGFVVGLDARTGKVRWETKSNGALISGVIVADGKVISGRACGRERDNCHISAHDARTGKELWRFYTVPAAGEPGDETWGGAPPNERLASPWGLAGGYDPARKLLVWGVANPMPNTRAARHGGNPKAVPLSAPADLYSNSTIALNPDTGKLAWYYQHLPGDDWDLDYTNERVLVRTVVNPDPKFVKWINPQIPRTEPRDVAMTVGEGGGVWALDRSTGQFLWATPFPYDTPNFLVSDIDVKTGKTFINENVLVDEPGKRRTICFWNTKSYWPMAYHPRLNVLFVPYVDNCLDMTAAVPETEGQAAKPELRVGARRPGANPNEFAGIATINVATGEVRHIYKGRAPGNGAMLATAGDVIFWGDLDQKFRAFDAESGKVLWESTLGGTITNSTITYAVNGKQYVAVFTGEGLITGNLINQAGLKPTRRYNALYVFSLP